MSTKLSFHMCFLFLLLSPSSTQKEGQQLWKENGEASKIKSMKKIIFITEVEREGDISKG